MFTWAEVTDHSDSPAETVRDFIRPALESVPSTLASRFGICRIDLFRTLPPPGSTSRWTRTVGGLDVELAIEGFEAHDAALELLLCLGQAAWDQTTPEERAAWLQLLDAEIHRKVEGEIDEEALEQKRLLLSSAALARSARSLLQYAGAAFAGTLAEYVHALWHDVTVHIGPEYLPPECLRRRLELFARWFPPEGGRRLFPDK